MLYDWHIEKVRAEGGIPAMTKSESDELESIIEQRMKETGYNP